MKKIALLFGLLLASPAFAADNAVIVTPGVGVTMKSKDIGSGVQAMQPILSDAAGLSIYGTAGVANANILTVQGIASMTPFLTTTTLNAETTKVIGTVRNIGNAGGVVDFAGQNAASPANAWLVGAQFNTTPTTLTTGDASPLQIDNAGNLLVNIKAGSSSGAVAQGSTTSGQSGNLVQCAVTTAAPTYTTAQTDPLSCDTAGNVRVNVTNANANVGNNTSAVATSGTAGSPVVNYPYGFNGTTWDQQLTLNNQIGVQVAQTVTASSAYASGNAVGGLMTVANAARVSGSLGASGTGGILQNVAVNSKSVQSSQMDIFIFNANPSGSTCTDKTAFSLVVADFDKVVGVISVPSTVTNNNGWFSGGTASVGQANNQAMAYDLSSATSLFACMVTRGTPTFTATTDISVKYNFLRN